MLPTLLTGKWYTPSTRPLSAGLLMILVLFASLLAKPHAAELKNQLKNHPSPYLSMHGEDPVNWQVWSKATLERARQEKKLLFVSSGYFSCHWCHVMQRESYQNAALAEFLNRHFIAVKVDRELLPALDAYLIDFVQRTRGQAGWPLNVFLTPEGYPLLGLTYQPAGPFFELLKRLHARWQTDAAVLTRMAQEAADKLKPKPLQARAELKPGLGEQLETTLVIHARKLGDELVGGFGNQTKFPSAPQMQALLRRLASKPDAKLEKLLRTTLDHMANQGLRDQLGGGFFRYTVDPNWQIPHFEKMLYTNAMLVEVYLTAAKLLSEPAYEAVARDTLDFMLDVLLTPEGAFIGSLSAVDAQGVEGGYYLWDEASLKRLLSEDELLVVRTVWGLQGTPALEAGHLPVQTQAPKQAAQQLGLAETTVRQRLTSARKKLLVARAARNLPRDDKRLTAWNGLALSALLRGASLQQGERYQAAARRLRDYLVTHAWDGKHLVRAVGAEGDASLEDYAYVVAGLLDWAKASNRDEDYALVKQVVEQGWKRFYTAYGWQLGENLIIPNLSAEPVLSDGPMPSPSALLVRVSLDLAARHLDQGLVAQARDALTLGHERLAAQPFWYATQIAVIAEHQADR